MARTVCKTVYQYDELSEPAKAKAIDWYREIWTSDGSNDWAENVIEDAVRMAGLLGIEIGTYDVKLMNGKTRPAPKVWYCLHVQGAGACFEGTYSYRAGSVDAMKREAPIDSELHAIAEGLREVQRKHGYALYARVSQRGNHCHSHGAEIEIGKSRGPHREPQELDSQLRRFMDWIYSQLEAEYDYQTGDEAVAETIRANEYEFDEQGHRST